MDNFIKVVIVEWFLTKLQIWQFLNKFNLLIKLGFNRFVKETFEVDCF